MSRTRNIYFEEIKQKVRWTQTSSENFKIDYKYVGYASEAEFDLLMELLWFLYEDREIKMSEFQGTYDEIRKFCDEIKGLVDKD